MRSTFYLAAALALLPALASAQDATDRRRAQAYDNLRNLEQSQRIGEVERQLDNMTLRQRNEQALRALQTPTRNSAPTPVVTPPAASTLTPEDIARDAELAASNERLREIAERQRLQAR